MQPLKIAIIDDETPARNRLRDLLQDCMDSVPTEIIGEAANGIEALSLLQTRSCHVALIDIRMPEMDGLELAQHLRKMETPPAIIFTTAYDVYAIKAFEVHAVDYLLKPIRQQRLQEALLRNSAAVPLQQEILQKLSHPHSRSHFSIRERGKIHLVPISEIIYLRSELKYVTARTHAREYLLEESLVRLEEELGDRFQRIHRNCLVARNHIAGFEKITDSDEAGWVVLLKDLTEKLPVSRRQQSVVHEHARHA